MRDALGKIARLFSGATAETTVLPEKPDELRELERDFFRKAEDNARASRRLTTRYLDNLDHTEHVRRTIHGVVDLLKGDKQP